MSFDPDAVALQEKFPELDVAKASERFYNGESKDDRDARSEFERDRARIIHSTAFRRLQGKTQIFAPAGVDYLRTRVTHSNEVAQIGRSSALGLGIPISLVEAACLAHDLGHPPFGHTGEEVLNDLMKGSGGFEGNAQTLHVVAGLERKTGKYKGLNLTRATLQGVLKYPYEASSGSKKFIYDIERRELGGWLFNNQETPLYSEKTDKVDLRRSVVCELMDWSDDIAYSTHDLEDGLVSGFLSRLHFVEIAAHEAVYRRLDLNGTADGLGITQELVKEILEGCARDLGDWLTYNDSGSVKAATRKWVNEFVLATAMTGDPALAKTFCDVGISVEPAARRKCEILKAVSLEFIVHDPRTATFRQKGKRVITDLFGNLFRAAGGESCGKGRDIEVFPRYLRNQVEEVAGNETILRRLVCDYIASMTDGQALSLHARMFDSSSSAQFDPV